MAIAIKIKPAAEIQVKKGHPWIYENSIIKQSQDGKAGDIVIIFDQKKNKFLALGLLDPNSPIRIKILSQKSVQINTDFFKSRLDHSLLQRSPLLSTSTSAFRWIYGENDQLPGMIIDVYNHTAVLKLYSAIWLPYLDLLTEAMNEVLPLDAILLRKSRRIEKEIELKEGIIYGHFPQEEIVFEEHGLKFKTNLIKGHKTGHFLDHRHNRLKIRQISRGKKVLDVFCYTGGFSINAAAGNATEVTSIDISLQALNLVQQNLDLNQLNTKHIPLKGDAFQKFELLNDQNKKFDLVIIDPPSFAKSEDQIKKAMHSYKRLIISALPLITKGGILLMASCSSRIDSQTFFDLVGSTIKKAGRSFQILEHTTHDIDHPIGIKELNYLKAIYLKL